MPFILSLDRLNLEMTRRSQLVGEVEEQKKEKVVPGIEPGSAESESAVITITLHNR